MENIDIEFYGNSDNLLLVLTGIGGTVKGYANKYVTLANNVTKTQDFSVAVATTPKGSWQHTKENLDFIMNFIKEKYKGKIYTMGTSGGANIILMHAHKYPQIKKILAINPVLNINFYKIKNGINQFDGNITMICGENDLSSSFCKIIKNNVKTFILKNIDHNFSNHLEDFINLPFKYLFTNEN